MRTCNKCRIEKPLVEENFSRATKGFNYTCKPCRRLVEKARYDANPARRAAAIRARKDMLRDQINVLKDVPCADCQGRFPSVCMDFDHLSDDKVDGVSKMIQRGFAIEAILAEVAKCEVVCANCHRVRTAARGENTSRSLRVAG